ncbi:unnamed protein product [Vitrella brassicaformis CCMP3155]|uniref:Uncharacterized protein n=1 Tax=Vitrella brassicaformis (strain CCMP3155) TaxID=1169540 RepID=A0A0G4EGS6_VITBC|nr:unnamed protein product [Vitrella brassicaformis CCMP3155]|eukprot:CEL94705.1 unnamed protein product [Vitrella brassicaformis CCMP3155]
MASTFAAIEEKQTAQYQLLRVPVLNEYLTMPHHERLPPPFNLIGQARDMRLKVHPSHVTMICVCAAVVVSEPLRYLASLISGQQSALCRIAFCLMKVLYFTIDALLCAVAFTPAFIYKALEAFPRAIRQGYLAALSVALVILLMPVLLLYQYARRGLSFFSFEATESDNSEMADKRRKARIFLRDSIDKWIEAADQHDSSVPDVMAALESMDRRHAARHSQIEKRLTELEAYIKAKLK